MDERASASSNPQGQVEHLEEDDESENWQTVNESGSDESDSSSEDDDSSDDISKRCAEEGMQKSKIVKGCVHYERSCQIVAPCW